MSIEAIIKAAGNIQELKRMREEIDAEIEALEDQIKSAMQEDEQIIAGPYKITYKAITSTRFDSTTFKKDHPDQYKLYAKTSTCKRFTIQ